MPAVIRKRQVSAGINCPINSVKTFAHAETIYQDRVKI